jgi:hypothetical protein
MFTNLHALDSACMERDMHFIDKSTLTITCVQLTKSNFAEGKAHLNAQFSVVY